MFKILIPIVAITNGFPGSQFGNLRAVGNSRNQAISSLKLTRNPTTGHHAPKSSNNAKWRAQLFGKDCTLKRTPRGRKRLVCANPDDEKEIKSGHGSGDHDPLMHYLEWMICDISYVKIKSQNKPRVNTHISPLPILEGFLSLKPFSFVPFDL